MRRAPTGDQVTRASVTVHGVEELVPGWYPDPAGSADTYRWWTGEGWTDLLTNDSAAPPPPSDARLRLVPAADHVGSRRGVTALVASAVLVIAFLVAATTVGSARGSGQPVLPRDPIPANPAPTAAAPWRIDSDRTLTFGSTATGRLPAEPYGRPGKPGATYGLFATGTSVSAVTTPRRGSAPEWSATVASGWVDESIATDQTGTTAENVLRQLPQTLFDGTTSTTAEVEIGPVTGLDEDSAVRVTAEIRYSVPGVPATHDDVVIIVIRTDPVNYAVWFSSVPDGASPAITKATAEAEAAVGPV